MKMDEEEFRRLDMEVAELRQEGHMQQLANVELHRETRVLRTRLDNALEEALRLRHKLEHIYAIARLGLSDEAARRIDAKPLDEMGKEVW
jgi:electron transfer flavoprotein alpha/beta subunit